MPTPEQEVGRCRNVLQKGAPRQSWHPARRAIKGDMALSQASQLGQDTGSSRWLAWRLAPVQNCAWSLEPVQLGITTVWKKGTVCQPEPAVEKDLAATPTCEARKQEDEA